MTKMFKIHMMMCICQKKSDVGVVVSDTSNVHITLQMGRVICDNFNIHIWACSGYFTETNRMIYDTLEQVHGGHKYPGWRHHLRLKISTLIGP